MLRPDRIHKLFIEYQQLGSTDLNIQFSTYAHVSILVSGYNEQVAETSNYSPTIAQNKKMQFCMQ